MKMFNRKEFKKIFDDEFDSQKMKEQILIKYKNKNGINMIKMLRYAVIVIVLIIGGVFVYNRNLVFRSGGNGGQSVNTTDSAVRITHIPTGVVATCQDEKSQLKNKLKAMSVLRSRLLQKQIDDDNAKQSEQRKSLIGTGDRSEKVRTYNFPQDRITDHRIGYSRSNIPAALSGDIDDLLNELVSYETNLSKT